MKSMTGWRSLVALLILSNCRAGSQNNIPRRLYSNVKFIPEAGDLIGFELEVKFEGTIVSGEFRDYEGACGIPTAVSGAREGTKLSLRGHNEQFGEVEIAGVLGENTARLTIRVGRDRPKIEKLKRSTKPHCREELPRSPGIKAAPSKP